MRFLPLPAAFFPLALLAASPDTALAADPVEVQVVHPARGDILRMVALPGSLRANQQVTLQAKIPGYVKRIAVDRGDRVEAGQLIAELEAPELAAERAQRAAELELATLESRRLAAARAQSPDLVTPLAVDAANGRLQVARAQLERAETLLRYANVSAPFAGVVTARFVDTGAFVPAATGPGNAAIVTVADSSVVRAQVAVPESEAARIRPGIPVRIGVEGLPGRTFPAAVSRHAHALDESTRTLWVEADVPNPDGTLRPGMYATVRLGVEQHANALLLPADAVGTEKAGPFVFAVRDGVVRKTPLKAGFQDGSSVEVLSGIAEGASVVSPAKTAPADGTAVKAKEAR